jgi:hypothetical protein
MMTARSIAEASKLVGVTERTGLRYLAQPQVKKALSHALDEVLAQATRRAVSAMAAALETLERIHGDEEAPHSTRVSAARSILTIAPRLTEVLDLAERVAELEAKLQEETPSGEDQR